MNELKTEINWRCSKCGSEKSYVDSVKVFLRDDKLLAGNVSIHCEECKSEDNMAMVEDSERSRVERTYLYDELPEEVQKKVHENYYDFNTDFILDVHHESVKYFFEEVGIESDPKRTYWDYGRSQTFYSDDIFIADEKKFWDNVEKKLIDEIDPDHSLRDNCEIGFGTNRYGGGDGANYINFEVNGDFEPKNVDELMENYVKDSPKEEDGKPDTYWEELSWEETEMYDKFWDEIHKKEEKIEAILKQWWNEFTHKILRALSDEWDDDSSPEAIGETMRCNEYRFNLKGKIVR